MDAALKATAVWNTGSRRVTSSPKEDRMRFLVGVFALGVSLALPVATSAAIYTPNPTDLNDLDHTKAYAWRIDVSGTDRTGTVNAASLTFTKMWNWNTSTNQLF